MSVVQMPMPLNQRTLAMIVQGNERGFFEFLRRPTFYQRAHVAEAIKSGKAIRFPIERTTGPGGIQL